MGNLLLEALLNNVKNGLYCALTISKEGSILANKYMNLKLKINDEVSVYELKVGDNK